MPIINLTASHPLLETKDITRHFLLAIQTVQWVIPLLRSLAGFQHYYGMDEYGNAADSDGMWGIWDHKFLPFFAEKLNEFPKPFFATLFTVSSHHPFKVPKEFEGKFKGGSKPILKCIEYTDYSLREFFKTISKEPWYKNTLFVFTADHCSSDIIFDESRTNWGYYSVPVFFSNLTIVWLDIQWRSHRK